MQEECQRKGCIAKWSILSSEYARVIYQRMNRRVAQKKPITIEIGLKDFSIIYFIVDDV
jgi:hypothetical protein